MRGTTTAEIRTRLWASWAGAGGGTERFIFTGRRPAALDAGGGLRQTSLHRRRLYLIEGAAWLV